MGKKRKDYHGPIIADIAEWASRNRYYVQQFHTGYKYIPKFMRGCPDLLLLNIADNRRITENLLKGPIARWPEWIYVEVKPVYDNGRRDILSDRQMDWLFNIFDALSYVHKYMVVKDMPEFAYQVFKGDPVYMEDYHKSLWNKYFTLRVGHDSIDTP